MLRSWVPGADGSGFPAEHLPYGVVSVGGGAPRVATRVGDVVVDLSRLARDGVGGLDELVGDDFDRPTLNAFMAGGRDRWREVRARLTELVCDASQRTRIEPALVPAADVTHHLPIEVADYVDFYSSIEHATNLGRLFRPDAEPLLPNWRHLPVAYHGRAGTVVVSGTPVVRPSGQRRAGDDITFGPTERLDIELEVGAVIGTPSTPGRPVPVGDAADHVFGLALVNDWSARDIQAWEYQPLGPFLGKSFATTLAPWITPLDALAPCRVPGPPQQPEPLPYLRLDGEWGFAVDLSVALRPAVARGEQVVSRTSFAGLYWRLPQQIAHLTVNGAHLRTGDLLASGTVSGPERGSEGSLIELTRAGAEPLRVAGATRTFLQDGDEVVLRASATVADGVTITLGEAAGRVVAAPGSDEVGAG
ncbi:MAG: fumarylacetoacetase [Acidimicrobiales bacterium]|nr:fumarylacetoacetase [Acidimicrobiales bacterium]